MRVRVELQRLTGLPYASALSPFGDRLEDVRRELSDCLRRVMDEDPDQDWEE